MARRSSEQEENHWPGFVDALSTIVMVVTFLLLIMAIAISIAAQNTSKNDAANVAEVTTEEDISSEVNESASRESEVTTEEQSMASSEQSSESQKEVSLAEAQSQEQQQQSEAQQASEQQQISQAKQEDSQEQQDTQEQDQSEQDVVSEKEGVSPGQSQAELSEELRQEAAPKSDVKLTIFTRNVDADEEKLEIANQEKPDEKTIGLDVNAADVLVSLTFDRSTTKVDEPTSENLKTFLMSDAGIKPEDKLNIWSFSSSQVGSISEAKRVAFYRGLSIRNELIKMGHNPENISVQLRIPTDEAQKNKVMIVKAPQ